jgi:hypothetical protein
VYEHPNNIADLNGHEATVCEARKLDIDPFGSARENQKDEVRHDTCVHNVLR